jgi:hypothetical protein
MNSLALNTRDRSTAIGVGLVIVVGLVLLLSRLFTPLDSLARGWLVAFAMWSSIPIGSVLLLAIHRLTGGTWGFAMAPVLRPAAALMPLVAIAFLPIVLALPAVYPWAADPASTNADVVRLYLNTPFFVARAAVALIGWSFLGVVLATGRGGQLVAALGLAFHGLIISLVAVDWYLSVDAGYTSTAFAAMISIQQILAALAFVAVIGAPALDGKTAGDLGGLMIASLLGVVYIEFMTFLIAWYGDLPDKASWYVDRSTTGWVVVLVIAVVLGALIPFGILLVRAARCSRFGVRVAGGMVLIGSALHFAWLLVPSFDSEAGPIIVACLALCMLTIVALIIGSDLAPALRQRETSHAG